MRAKSSKEGHWMAYSNEKPTKLRSSHQRWTRCMELTSSAKQKRCSSRTKSSLYPTKRLQAQVTSVVRSKVQKKGSTSLTLRSIWSGRAETSPLHWTKSTRSSLPMWYWWIRRRPSLPFLKVLPSTAKFTSMASYLLSRSTWSTKKRRKIWAYTARTSRKCRMWQNATFKSQNQRK